MSAASASPVSFPSGSWTLYFHDPEDTKWSPDSYKKIGTFTNFTALWGALAAVEAGAFLSGMYFLMNDPSPPSWDHRSNINGGTYCIKVPEVAARETFERYAAASIIGLATTDAANKVVGISISPKKGFHIIKVWNAACKSFSTPTDLALLGEGTRVSDILYRRHVDQRF